MIRRFGLVTRHSSLVTLLALGCARPPAPVELGGVAVAAAPAAGADAPGSPAQTPATDAPDPPPAFPFPDDPAGRALPAVVAPPAGAAIPADRSAGPKPRTPPARVESPDPPLKATFTLPPLSPGAATAGMSAIRPPVVPPTFGAWAAATPPRAKLPNPPGVTARGPDIAAVPPPAPTARPVTERPPADDPVAAAGDAVVTRPAAVVLGAAGFVRVVIPDPFELAGHVRASPRPADEPVAVPPRRPR
jgi:hypothetical protein